MNITHLKYFNEVCKWQSISKAALALHISQPTISIAIKELEKETGLNLFIRIGKRLLLTDDGQLVWQKIIPILSSFENLDKEIKDLSQNKNHIRLAVPPQIGVFILPLLFTEFKELHPDINLEIIETGGIDALSMLEADDLDISLTNYDNKFSNNLTYHKLCYNEICFCTSKKNHSKIGDSITLKNASDCELVLLNGNFFINRVIQNEFAKENLFPNVLLYSSQLHTIKNLVSNGIANTFLMKHAILPNDDIATIPLNPRCYINSGVVTKKGKNLHKNELILLNFIATKLADSQPFHP